MAEPGKINNLRVVKQLTAGLYLDGEDLGEILLPNRYIPENCRINDNLDVFVYFDSEDRIIATTLKPYAQVGETAWLKAVDITDVGAFLDWGLAKDLLVPFSEQAQPMKKDRFYLVYVYLDAESQLIAASSRLEKFIAKQSTELRDGQAVDLIIAGQTDLGYKAIIDHKVWGVLYQSEIFQELTIGQRISGWVKKVRPDGKIDLCLQQPGYEKVPDLAEQIIRVIAAHGGFIDVTDKSTAEEINDMFGVSKKTFKKAIGALYKSRRITLENDGIALSR
ncbi:MAG: S1-like domain-containing RNA-binding protein [Desulfosalsimonadaceae bacterium]